MTVRAHSLAYITVATLALSLAAGCGDDSPAADAQPPAADAAIDGATDAPVGPGGDAAADGSEAGACDVQLACPPPSAGKVTLCGQLFDLQSSAKLQADAPTGALCEPSNPTSTGPCALAVSAYDVIAVVSDPASPEPLPFAERVVDDCGHFRLTDVDAPATGRAALLVEGVDSADFQRTGIVVGAVAGQAVDAIQLHSLRTATDTAWTDSAGLAGDSFATRGVLVALFSSGGAPVAGVTLANAGDVTFPDDDHYFSDTDAAQRLTVAPDQTSTGANGTALLVDQPSIAIYTGSSDSAPRGCEWPSAQAATLPGIVFVQPFEATLSGSGGQPCE